MFLACVILKAQRLTYDVVRNGNSIGTTLVERASLGDSLSYHLNTQTEFRIIFLIEVEYDLEETFINNKLISGTSYNTLNGSKQKDTKMKLKADHYDLVIDGIRTIIHQDSISESVSEIYFEEPYDHKRVFSAYFGRYLYFEKVGEHKYSLSSPDGNNVYSYENGICTEVLISRDFATFSQVLQPELLANVRRGIIRAE